MTPRLTLERLQDLPAGVGPGYDPRGVDIGVVHLGLGAFSRAHIAVYTDTVLAAGDRRWGILGASQRSTAVPDALRPQDGLYAVLEADGGLPGVRVVGAVRELACGAVDPETIVARIASAAVSVVTMTVTEKGYRFDASSGRLREDDPELAADLAGRPPRTLVGQLCRGLDRRRGTCDAPVTLVCCDNLTSNGSRLRGLVMEFAERARDGEGLASWIEACVAFPSTMVDRIVPATTEENRKEASRLLGVWDEGTVVAEPFSQWVIEETFAGPRPAWEDAGAMLADDVAAYERVKLRMLNATHSLVAYLGALAGYETIAEALSDDRVAAAARRLIAEQRGTVDEPPGLDLDAYGEQVLSRFRNPGLGHRTVQVAMDGSQKLPQRLVGALRERRAAGRSARMGALLIAAWIRALAGRTDAGGELVVSDPMREDVVALLGRGQDDAATVRAVLGIEAVFGAGLAEDHDVVSEVAGWYGALRQHGVLGALQGAD